MRRRRTAHDTVNGESAAAKALDTLKQLDVYTKVSEECTHSSQAGGLVSVITAFIILFLLWSELNAFLAIDVVDSVAVDTRLHQKLMISMNVSFPRLRCDVVSVDSVDSAGDNQVDVHGGLEKLHMDIHGRITSGDPVVKDGDCFPCMQASDPNHECCNTCSDLKAAYFAKDLSYESVLTTAPQCKNSVGCRVQGRITVNKVSGNVHVALGHSVVQRGKHVHQFDAHDVSGGFNTSHDIHAIRFGEHAEGMAYPLDGVSKTVRTGAFMFHYYAKLVPTLFVDPYGNEVYTHQYTVTETSKNVLLRSGEFGGLPGLFIVYDFSAFLVVKTQKAKPWVYLLRSLCALIGGVCSVSCFVEICLHHLVKALSRCSPSTAAVIPI